MRGILLIAIGSDFYGELAYSLANSLRKNSCDLPIALICDKPSIVTLPSTNVFSQIIDVNLGLCLENGIINPFKLKTYIYDITPFEETLYLDVDALCLKHIGDLIAQIEKHDLVIYEVRRYNPEAYKDCTMVWYKNAGIGLKEALTAYGINGSSIYPEYNSSFIWFKKNDKTKAYFDQAKKNYFDRRIKFKAIGKCYPDELAYNMASIQSGLYSGIERFRPIHFKWDDTKGNKPIGDLRSRYWFLGMAGAAVSMSGTYDRINRGYGVHFRFKNRKKIIHRK